MRLFFTTKYKSVDIRTAYKQLLSIDYITWQKMKLIILAFVATLAQGYQLSFFIFSIFSFFHKFTSKHWLGFDDRIVGGTAEDPHVLPFIANIKRNGNLMCGGSLISTRFILTAAHCYYRCQCGNHDNFTNFILSLCHH